MKLGICIPTPEYGRYAACQDYIDQMTIPIGTIIVKPHGQSPAMNRNMAIDALLAQECDYILFIDDDVIVPKDLFVRLVSHGQDIVSGLYLARAFPHIPLIFSMHDGARSSFYYPKDGQSELIEVENCGLGACLVRSSVFATLEKPYIRLGEIVKDHWGDDTGFFFRVRQTGIKIYCDLSAQVGHMAAVCVSPVYKDGKWLTSYNTFGTDTVAFPAVRPASVSELIGAE